MGLLFALTFWVNCLFQLEIKHVHIRYEDDVTAHQPFSFGVTIDSLSVQSCDAKWVPGYKSWDVTDEYSFQLMSLTGLSIYLDILSANDFWKTEDLDLVS